MAQRIVMKKKWQDFRGIVRAEDSEIPRARKIRKQGDEERDENK
jgi:hypothetical protein